MGHFPLAEVLSCDTPSPPLPSRCSYYVGVNAYQTGDFARAVDYFGRATKAACGSVTEEDFGAFLLQESRKGLKLAQAAVAAEANQ